MAAIGNIYFYKCNDNIIIILLLIVHYNLNIIPYTGIFRTMLIERRVLMTSFAYLTSKQMLCASHTSNFTTIPSAGTHLDRTRSALFPTKNITCSLCCFCLRLYSVSTVLSNEVLSSQAYTSTYAAILSAVS